MALARLPGVVPTAAAWSLARTVDASTQRVADRLIRLADSVVTVADGPLGLVEHALFADEARARTAAHLLC